MKHNNSIFIFLIFLIGISFSISAQDIDTISHQTVTYNIADSQHENLKSEIQQLLFLNKSINFKGKPIALAVQSKMKFSRDYLFYLMLSLMLCLGLFRIFNDRYFVNILRVFFNTTLRQNQLVDQLLQVKIPSLFLNLFFSAVAGIYVFLMISKDGIEHNLNSKLLSYCMVAVLIMYSVKYFTIKFFGWLTQLQNEADSYIFIVFLLNKILGIFLLPIVFIISFADNNFRDIIITISFLLIGFVFLLRYFRAYDMLKYKLKLSIFNFILYVLGVEILPILLISKQALIIMNNN